jgi:hypothetical protein
VTHLCIKKFRACCRPWSRTLRFGLESLKFSGRTFNPRNVQGGPRVSSGQLDLGQAAGDLLRDLVKA